MIRFRIGFTLHNLFHLRVLRIACSRPIAPNLLRGAFGASLKRVSAVDYEKYFIPSGAGPSGFLDWPRPFVFRLREPGVIQMNCFVTDDHVLERFVEALRGIRALGTFTDCQTRSVSLTLNPSRDSVNRLRVHFLTPTELKGAKEPVFGVLLSRLRDRISTLSTLWGQGPLDIDFKTFGERASRVVMTKCELQQVQNERLSKSTGQRHPLSGFIGFADYQGDLTEFVPYLEIGRDTGVGRQTVWGKGEIAVVSQTNAKTD